MILICLPANAPCLNKPCFDHSPSKLFYCSTCEHLSSHFACLNHKPIIEMPHRSVSSPVFQHSLLREFLLTKLINAEISCYKAQQFSRLEVEGKNLLFIVFISAYPGLFSDSSLPCVLCCPCSLT